MRVGIRVWAAIWFQIRCNVRAVARPRCPAAIRFCLRAGLRVRVRVNV